MAFKKKETTSKEVFSLTVPLHCEIWQTHQLDKLFKCCNNMKNAFIADRKKALTQLERTKAWKTIQNDIAEILKKKVLTKAETDSLKMLYKQQKELLEQYGFSEYQFHSLIKPFRKHYKGLINSSIAQKIASDIWKAFEKYLYSDGKEVHFSKWTNFLSISAKDNKTGIIYTRNNILKVGKMLLKVAFNKHDRYNYETKAMKQPIHFCGITRKWYPEGWRYFVQFYLGGTPPVKVIPETGELLHPLGIGRVGNDIGPQTLAVVGDNKIDFMVLADQIDTNQHKIGLLLRAMDRSRRATNPQMYKPNGEIVPKNQLPKELLIATVQRNWYKSKRYLKLESELRYYYRKQADLRDQQHNEMANKLIGFGDIHYIETMNWKALAKKSKETKKSKTGKNLSRKRFGKSIINRAPASLVDKYEARVLRLGGQFYRTNTVKCKASQYQHDTMSYHKKSLSKRVVNISGHKILRDPYSAFLIQHTNATLDGFLQSELDSNFSNFLKLHNELIFKLQQSNKYFPSSMGIKK